MLELEYHFEVRVRAFNVVPLKIEKVSVGRRTYRLFVRYPILGPLGRSGTPGGDYARERSEGVVLDLWKEVHRSVVNLLPQPDLLPCWNFQSAPPLGPKELPVRGIDFSMYLNYFYFTCGYPLQIVLIGRIF